MKLDKVKVSLKSQDGLDYSFDITQSDEKTLCIVAYGKTVGRITVEPLERKVKDEDGDYHVKRSKDDFYLHFKVPNWKDSVSSNHADVMITSLERTHVQ